MSRTLVLALGVLTMTTGEAAAGPLGVPKVAVFGKAADGADVSVWTLTSKSGVTAKVMALGATLIELQAPDKNGKAVNVVFGFDDVAGYQSDRNGFFGCTTGRVANRIAKGKFTLDGKEYRLAVNNGVNHLHGGVKRSLDKVHWKGESIPRGVRFIYSSPDGEEGFPGKLDIAVTFTLSDKGELRIDYEAKTDKATPVNLTNHSYFNLAGAGADTVLDHELTVDAKEYTPVDEGLIPTGKIAPVAGTPLDFTKPHKIGERIGALVKTPTIGYDHNFVLSKRGAEPTFAARLRDPASGRIMTVSTTEPGVQIYSGNFLTGQKGKDGKTYKQRSAVCLETQHFPDSVNQPAFPSVILRPGQTYRHSTVFAFTAE